MANKVLFFTLVCILCNMVESARILGVFHTLSRSHYILGNALMKGLAEAGHDVTIISPFEEKNPPKLGSYRDIVLTGFQETYNITNKINLLENKEGGAMNMALTFLSLGTEVTDGFFGHEKVQQLINSNETFDVVIVEQFLNEAMKMLGNIFDAPVIAFSTLGPNSWVNNMVGNPEPLSYIPQMQVSKSPYMSFTERMTNCVMYLTLLLLDRLYHFPKQNDILKKYFSNPPDIYDLNNNVSLVLLNSHESLNQPVPIVPNMVHIGGFHISPPKKLPKDLQEYLDSATEGVVYFSMGSNLNSKDLPPYKRDAFLKAFDKLKQKVLWKWEDDNLPGKPSNVKLAKWFPQQDVLAHPNVKLFITHGGLLSTTETVYHGVPILAIPVFGDQHMNAEIATYNGYALSLPYEDPSFSEEQLSQMLQELLTNPKYMDNIKRRSQLFHDRPMKPMDTAVYWVEYIIRNRGAPHIRVVGATLPWYKYHSLDVIGFVFLIQLVIVYLHYVVIKRALSWWRKSRTIPKIKSKKA